MFNQFEIDSVDQHHWRNQRQILLKRVKNFCFKNNIEFTSKITTDLIKQSTKEKIVHMWLFDSIAKYNHWQELDQACKQVGKTLLVITDNIIKFNNLKFVKFFSYPELLGVTATHNDITINNTTPKKLYNCFIQRADVVRQSWFYFLHHYALLDKGYVSFLLKQLINYSELTGKELFEFIHHSGLLYQLPNFDLAYHDLKNQVPYRNFDEIFNLVPLILDSKYSLILETYAIEDDTDAWCFTEKLLRTLQFPTFNLPFIQKGGIEILELLGFKFNLDLNSIDQLSWQERQQKLLQILINDTVDYDANMLYKCTQSTIITILENTISKI